MDSRPKAANCSEVLSTKNHRCSSTDSTVVLDCADPQNLSVAIAESISAIADVDPCQLQTRLYDVVDPDALRRTVQSGGPEMQISFEFGAYHVSISGTGELVVTDPTADDA